MTDPAFGLATIGQIMVPVRDAEVAAAFYRDVLGMHFLFAFPHMAFFDADGVRLYLAEPEEPDFRGRSTLYFRVPDIAAAVRTLQASGVVFEDYDLPGLKTVDHVCVLGAEKAAWFKDTEGNFLCIHEDIA